MRCPGLQGRQALAVWNQVENVQQRMNLCHRESSRGRCPPLQGRARVGRKGTECPGHWAPQRDTAPQPRNRRQGCSPAPGFRPCNGNNHNQSCVHNFAHNTGQLIKRFIHFRKEKSLHKVKTGVGQQKPMAGGDTTACPDLPCQSHTPFLSYEAELPGFTTALHKVY